MDAQFQNIKCMQIFSEFSISVHARPYDRFLHKKRNILTSYNYKLYVLELKDYLIVRFLIKRQIPKILFLFFAKVSFF